MVCEVVCGKRAVVFWCCFRVWAWMCVYVCVSLRYSMVGARSHSEPLLREKGSVDLLALHFDGCAQGRPHSPPCAHTHPHTLLCPHAQEKYGLQNKNNKKKTYIHTAVYSSSAPQPHLPKLAFFCLPSPTLSFPHLCAVLSCLLALLLACACASFFFSPPFPLLLLPVSSFLFSLCCCWCCCLALPSQMHLHVHSVHKRRSSLARISLFHPLLPAPRCSLSSHFRCLRCGTFCWC